MYVSAIGIVAEGISCYLAHYSFGHHVNTHINLIKPTANYNGATLNEKGMIPKVKGGFSNLWGSLGVHHVSATLLISSIWEQLLLSSGGCGRTVSPCPRSYSTSGLFLFTLLG